MRLYYLLLLFLSVFIKAQISVTGNFSMKPDPYHAKVLDSSYQNMYYKLEFAKDSKNSTKKTETICILQLGKNYSRFSDFNGLRKDSLMSKFSQMEKLGAKELNQTLNLSENWKNIIIKSFKEDKIFVQDIAKNTYQYEEKQPVFTWKLENESKDILGYKCQKATTEYRGRKYTAWYSKDIVINNGPYVFQGLPGLIMELSDSKSNFHFMAIALDKKVSDIYLRDEKNILNVNREQFRNVQQSYHENPGFFLGQSYDTNGNPVIDKWKPRPYNPIELE